MTTYCELCGQKAERAMILAIMIDLGCTGPDPNYCYKSEDHEHVWVNPPELRDGEE